MLTVNSRNMLASLLKCVNVFDIDPKTDHICLLEYLIVLDFTQLRKLDVFSQLTRILYVNNHKCDGTSFII